MKKYFLIILGLLLGFSTFGFSAKNSSINPKQFLVQTAFSFIYKSPKMTSKVVTVVEEGDKIWVLSRLSKSSKWLKVRKGKKIGFILVTSLTHKLQPVNENIYNIVIKKKKNKTLSSSKRGFSEEEELSAASKGFSEEEEISAASKGFSEEEELSAATKGFSEEEELSAATKGFSEEEELSAATKGFSEEEELSAATKGFSEEDEIAASSKGIVKKRKKRSSRRKKGFTKNDDQYRNKVLEKNEAKKGNIPIIFAKYYVFNKKAYYTEQKKMLRLIKKRRVRSKKRKKSKR